MGIKERRQTEIGVIRKKIINAASEILASEGYEKLSIRKIADKIEYSPGIIYHYFKDKSEIVTCVVEEGYGNILTRVNEIPLNVDNPEETMKKRLRAYIDLMLEMPQQFRAILMNDIEAIQEKVNMLEEGISKKRNSIAALCNLIDEGIRKGKFREIDTELTAQIIWTSTHGLISRLIIEKNISLEQRERLINHHFEILINGIIK